MLFQTPLALVGIDVRSSGQDIQSYKEEVIHAFLQDGFASDHCWPAKISRKYCTFSGPEFHSKLLNRPIILASFERRFYVDDR